MPAGTSFNIGVWYSGTPEQFLVERAGLVDKYYLAREKRITAQKNWDKMVTSIVKYEKKNKEDGPFRDYEAILKSLRRNKTPS
jgi:hypothetical protein